MTTNAISHNSLPINGESRSTSFTLNDLIEGLSHASFEDEKRPSTSAIEKVKVKAMEGLPDFDGNALIPAIFKFGTVFERRSRLTQGREVTCLALGEVYSPRMQKKWCGVFTSSFDTATPQTIDIKFIQQFPRQAWDYLIERGFAFYEVEDRPADHLPLYSLPDDGSRVTEVSDDKFVPSITVNGRDGGKVFTAWPLRPLC